MNAPTITPDTHSTRIDLLCIGQEDWDEVWRRNQFLLAGLARTGTTRRILFVEPPCDVTFGLRSRAFLRASSGQYRKLRNALHGPRRCSDAPGLWLLTPLKLLPNSVPLLRRVNEWLERVQVRLAMHRLRMTPDVLWTQNPEAAHWFEHMTAPLKTYDATDDWSLLDGPRQWVDVVRRGQESLARRADLVLACSPALFDKWSVFNTRTHLAPNGVDVAHFAQTGHVPLPHNMPSLRRPILGYTGTLHDDRIDVELVQRVASLRPDWQLLFVGPDLLSARSRALLGALPNVRIIGQRPYQRLPAYMSAFDVCIIPHRVTPFTESLNPIKIYEYLATGLPIIATPVATVRDVDDGTVYLADDADSFVERVEVALTEGEVHREQRVELARRNAWTERVDLCRRLLQGMESAPRVEDSRVAQPLSPRGIA